MKVDVEFIGIEEMNLAGLMIGRMIERNLSHERIARRCSRMHGKIGIVAGRMEVTLELDRGTVRIRGGLHRPLRATIRGSLTEFLEVAVGKSPIVSFLQRRVRIAGNPLFALKIMPLVRVISEH